MNKLLEVEKMYTHQYANMKKESFYTIFDDPKIPGMYVHNFVFLDSFDQQAWIKLFNEQIELRRSQRSDFFRAEYHQDIKIDFVDQFILKPSIDFYDLMSIDTKAYETLKDRECTIVKAIDEQVMADGRKVDIEANQEIMGRDFAIRRIDRKIDAYQNSPIDFYVLYDSMPIGNCEMYCFNGICKIEDFDMLPEYQKKGYGTAFLKHLLKEAYEKNNHTAYVVTDAEDTAKVMYKKCGFKKVGTKTELIFDF